MATSGSFRTYGYSDAGYPDHYVFSWSLVNQSIEGNYSDISWSLYGDGGTNQYYYTIVQEKYVTVNGSTQSNATQQYTYNGTTPFSGTARIYHNNDGTGSFSASAGGAFFYYVNYNSTGSGSWDLPTIPRKANITSAPNFNDEQNPTINYSNLAGNTVSSLQACISLTGSADDIVYRDIPKTGTSYTFNLTDAERNVLRNATTGSNSRTVYFYVRTVLGGNTFYSSEGRTLSIINANPTLGTFTYKDSNSVTTAISENNQRIIRNNSNLLFSIGSATAKKGATISKYEVTFNQVTKSRTSAGDLDFGTINLSSNATATLNVTDSRGNTVKKNVTVIIDDWVLPTALISVNRKNNFYSETYIKVDGTCSRLNGKNVMSIQYQYKKVSDKNFSAFYDLEDNVQSTINLDNEYQWNISVVVTDKIGQTTYNLVLDRGMPIVFFDRLKNSVGINSFPKNEKSIEENGNQMFGLETGSWTPTIGVLNEDDPTVTYEIRRGNYFKMGKLVYIQFIIRGKVTKLNGTNNYGCIKGLPFTPKNYAVGEQGITTGVIYQLVTNPDKLVMCVGNGVIRIQNNFGSGATTLKTTTETAYCEVGGSGWYEIE